MTYPKVSIIILNWNGLEDTKVSSDYQEIFLGLEAAM